MIGANYRSYVIKLTSARPIQLARSHHCPRPQAASQLQDFATDSSRNHAERHPPSTPPHFGSARCPNHLRHRPSAVFPRAWVSSAELRYHSAQHHQKVCKVCPPLRRPNSGSTSPRAWRALRVQLRSDDQERYARRTRCPGGSSSPTPWPLGRHETPYFRRTWRARWAYGVGTRGGHMVDKAR